MSGALKNKISKKEELILQTARNLFFRDGFKKVTVEQIVAEAKVSKRTFYKYFADKPAIIEAVSLAFLKRSKSVLAGLIDKGETGILTETDFLKAFDLNEYDYYFQSEALPEYAKDILKEYPELIRSLTQYFTDNILPKYAELIDKAKSQGIIRDDIDTELYIQYSFNIRVAIKNTIINNAEMVKRIGTKRLTEQCLEWYLSGIIIK